MGIFLCESESMVDRVSEGPVGAWGGFGSFVLTAFGWRFEAHAPRPCPPPRVLAPVVSEATPPGTEDVDVGSLWRPGEVGAAPG